MAKQKSSTKTKASKASKASTKNDRQGKSVQAPRGQSSRPAPRAKTVKKAAIPKKERESSTCEESARFGDSPRQLLPRSEPRRAGIVTMVRELAAIAERRGLSELIVENAEATVTTSAWRGRIRPGRHGQPRQIW